MIRKYRAIYNDGHDFGEFEYYSNHRQGSKQNRADMEKEYIKKYGYKRFTRVKCECIGKIDE